MSDEIGNSPEMQLLRREIDKALSERSDMVERSGGGDHTGGMDAWQQTVETRLGELREEIRDLRGDFRWTWAGLAVAFITLGGMLIAGYLRVEDQLNTLIDKLP